MLSQFRFYVIASNIITLERICTCVTVSQVPKTSGLVSGAKYERFIGQALPNLVQLELIGFDQPKVRRICQTISL
jgi:hypothetical protein